MLNGDQWSAGSRNNPISPTFTTRLLDLTPFTHCSSLVVERSPKLKWTTMRCVSYHAVVCERQCLCIIIILVIVSSSVQTQCVMNEWTNEALHCTPYPDTWYLHKLLLYFVKTVTNCTRTSSVSVYHQYFFVMRSNSLVSVGKLSSRRLHGMQANIQGGAGYE